MKECLNCKKEIKNNKKFCDNSCHREFLNKEQIKKWKLKKWTGTTGYGQVSDTIKKYIFEKNKNKCEICGWDKVNKKTNKIPLQIHHIDGNALNNFEENIQLLCPNCHSLTENFGSLNKQSQIKKQKTRTLKVCKICGKNFLTYGLKEECDECSENKTIKEKNFCTECGKEITKHSKSGKCRDCAIKSKKMPSKEELEFLIKNKNILQISKDFGLSDNAIRKWLKKYNLPFKKNTIKEFKKNSFLPF